MRNILLLIVFFPLLVSAQLLPNQGIYQESEISKSNQRRLEELEREWREMGPRIERIDARLEQLMVSQGMPLLKK